MLVGTHNRAVDEDLFKIRIQGQLGEDTMPHATARPAGKALIDTIPEAERRRQITPRTACPGNPQHRFDKQPIICRRAARIARFAWQQRGYPLELIITQPHTYHPDSAQKSGYDHNLPSVNSPLGKSLNVNYESATLRHRHFKGE